jgi:diguanylate cyclase (GGDEF)-like protein/PAS domain S-box-containing protein
MSLRQWALVALALAVLATMVTVAETARHNTDEHRRAQVLVERVRSTSQAIGALNTETLANGLAPKTFAVDPALVKRGFELYGQLNRATVELEEVQPGRHTQQLKRDATDMYTAGTHMLAIARLSDVRTSSLARAAIFRPLLERFEKHAQEAAASAAKDAKDASTWAGRLFVGSLVVGLLMLLMLGWRLQRLGRAAAMAEERRAAERRSEERVRALVENSSDVVTVVGSDLTVRWQAGSIQRMLGHDPAASIGRPLVELVHPDEAGYVEALLAASIGRPGGLTFGARFRHGDGSWRHVEARGQNRVDDPAVEGVVLSMRDVTDRKSLEDELRHQAFHDSLTGLANRALFEDRLTHALAGARRDDATAAVIFLDLDDFKTINDSLGHGRGDELLGAVAERIASIVRPTDTAARLGGDEFGVLLDKLDEADEADQVGRRLLDALAAPFAVGERELRVCASVGIALSDGSHSADEVLRNADTALYAAKDRGKNTIQRFEPSMHRRVLDRLDLTAQIQTGLRAGEFELDYQPIVQLDDGGMAGVEALVRWRHPQRGRLAPGEFIGLAEETGLIVPLGLWILETACAQANAWHAAFPERAPLHISVNVSTRQLQEPSFPAAVAEVLQRTGLDPATLMLEITESLLAEERDLVITRLNDLKALGLSVAVDDFGTGYSALSSLQDFPIDVLKIDRSFVDGLEHDEAKANLVRGIVDLGGSLHLSVVAEGIEEREQADQLLAMRSPLGQGFLFSRPVGRDEIDALLRDGVRFGADAGAPR